METMMLYWKFLRPITLVRAPMFLVFPLFYEIVSDYRAVGLSSRRTIDTHPKIYDIKSKDNHKICIQVAVSFLKGM